MLPLLFAAAMEVVDEAPPMAPRKTGVVVESSIGAMGFTGAFGRIAPPGPWLATQVGWEPFRWLMAFAYGELTLTDTSRAQGPTKLRAFPLFGLGAGARVTVRASERVAIFVQANLGLGKADVPINALANLGFRDAEGLRPTLGGRLGVEWYQLDPHLALALTGGARFFSGLSRDIGGSTVGWESAVSLRYAF